MKYFADLKIVAAGDVSRCRQAVDRRAASVAALNYITSGGIELRVDSGEPARLGAGAAYWTWPGPRVRVAPDSHGYWDERWIVVAGPRVDRWIEGGLLATDGRPFEILAHQPRFEADFARLIALGCVDQAHVTAEQVHLLEGLLLQIHVQRCAPGQSPPLHVAASDLARRIADRPFDDINFHRTAKQWGVSYAHLRRTFRRVTGRPLHAYVLACRMRAAARLIEQRPQRLEDVAVRLGYDSYYYFSRLFKHHMGLSPRQFLATLPPPKPDAYDA
jgi:AraC-like DNA-binding protein